MVGHQNPQKWASERVQAVFSALSAGLSFCQTAFDLRWQRAVPGERAGLV
jgi:hypothetical protein